MAQSVFANPRPRYVKTDDPLADLAAITGYRGEAVPANDFAIDLERELLGAFGETAGAELAEDDALNDRLQAGFDAAYGSEPMTAPSTAMHGAPDGYAAATMVDEFGAEFDAAFENDLATHANSNDAQANWSAEPQADWTTEPQADWATEPQATWTTEPQADWAADGAAPPAGDAFIDLDFGDFDPADFDPAHDGAAPAAAEDIRYAEDETYAAEAVDPFEAELSAHLSGTAATGEPDFESELAAVLDHGALTAARGPVHTPSTSTHLTYAEQAHVEPAYAEPAYAEPTYSEQAYAEQADVEPGYAEQAYAEPVYSEPAYAESAPVSAPTFAEPAYAEPAYGGAAPGGSFRSEPAQPVAPAAGDPFAELAALAASYKLARPSVFARAPSWTVNADRPAETAAPAAEMPPLTRPAVSPPALAAEPMAVEELAIDEDAYAADDYEPAYGDDSVPLTDEFEIPELAYEAETPPPSDPDIDFSPQAAPAFAPAPMAQASAAPIAAARPLPARQTADVTGFEDELDAFFSRDLDRPAPPAAVAPQPAGRRSFALGGMLPWAGVAVLAVIAGAAAYSYVGRDAAPSQPMVIKADPDPVKVKPANPGGTAIANQDQAVYDKVSGAEAASTPAQTTLVTAGEEPVDVAAFAADKAPAKGEDRVVPADDEQAAQSGMVAVQPKKVRTLVVRPDGTLVARPAEPVAAAPVVEDAPSVAPVSTEAAKPVDGTEGGVSYQPPVGEEAAADPLKATIVDPVKAAIVDPVKEAVVDPVKEAIADTVDAAAAAVEEAPKPVAKPKAETAKKAAAKKPAAEEVALATAKPAASGAWSVQIASQPTPEGAQASYKALSSKFGSIIGGRGVTIVQAEIAGKGTFYRVRVPAGSKDEANALCARYQAAGGSCFITR